MASNISKYRVESTEEPFVLVFDSEGGEAQHMKLTNPNRLVGRAYSEFLRRSQSDYDYGFRVLAGKDRVNELWDMFDREKIDGEGQQKLLQDVMEHYGFDSGESDASSS